MICAFEAGKTYLIRLKNRSHKSLSTPLAAVSLYRDIYRLLFTAARFAIVAVSSNIYSTFTIFNSSSVNTMSALFPGVREPTSS